MLLAVYVVVIAFVFSFSSTLRRPYCLVLLSNRRSCKRSSLSSVRLFNPLIVVVLLWRSGALSMCRPSCLWQWNLLQVISYFCQIAVVIYSLLYWVWGYLVFLSLLLYYGVLVLCLCTVRLTAMAVEFALSHLIFLSNYSRYIRSALLSCRVIWSLCCFSFVAAFLPICLNVSWTPFVSGRELTKKEIRL